MSTGDRDVRAVLEIQSMLPSDLEGLAVIKKSGLAGMSVEDVGELAKVPGIKEDIKNDINGNGSLKERIKKLLIAGASPGQVASALGLDKSYVSQVSSNTAFTQEVIAERATRRSEINDKYDELETKLLKQLEDIVDNSLVPMKPFELFRAMAIVGQRKREAVLPMQEALAQQGTRETVVQLKMNPRVAHRFIIDGKRDVIGIEVAATQDKNNNEKETRDTQVFAPMPSAQLLADVKAIEAVTKVKQKDTKTPAESQPQNQNDETFPKTRTA